MNSHSQPEDERMIVIAQRSGQMQPRNFTGQEATDPSVDIIERSIHLQNALAHLATVSQKDGLINSYIRGRLRSNYPANLDDLINSRGIFASLAQREFIAATGYEALVAAGLMDENQAEEKNKAMFSVFLTKYHANRHSRYKQKENDPRLFRQKLVRSVDAIQQQHTLRNRQHGLRPHQSTIKKTSHPEAQPPMPESDEGLDTPARLRAIMVDPRAGFIPTTHREKNQVLAFLDYLDNPDYPFGVNNQFLEIFNHSQVVRRRNKGVDSERPAVSITYEFGDYLKNAIEQIDNLRELEKLLNGPPRLDVTLHEERDWIDLSHPGFRALVRYRDLSDLTKTSTSSINNPLLTRIQRWTNSGPGQHKVVQDSYTAPEISQTYDDHIKAIVAQMSVGEAKDLVKLALRDQYLRELFMRQRLHEIASLPRELIGKARDTLSEASAAAYQILVEVNTRDKDLATDDNLSA